MATAGTRVRFSVAPLLKLALDSNSSMQIKQGLNQMVALKCHCPDTAVVGVCDREADLYDLFVTARAAGVDWLVRAAWNRGVDHPGLPVPPCFGAASWRCMKPRRCT